MATTRADKITQTTKQEFFSDFLDDFDTHPISHSLVRVTNENAVKQSIRNLILTNYGERLFQPNVGSDVFRALFDMNDVIAAENLTFYIRNTITHNEPRALLLNVKVIAERDKNALVVNVIFSLINSNVPVTLDVILKRVR
jgi:hypothetical protein